MPRVTRRALILPLAILACHAPPTAPVQLHADALLAARTVVNTVCSWPEMRCDSIVVARSVNRSANDLPTPAETLSAFSLSDSLQHVVPFRKPVRLGLSGTQPVRASGLVYVALYAVALASSDTLHRYVVAVYSDVRSSPDIALVVVVRRRDQWVALRPSFLMT